jgi:Leucine-rich repeat (LRR) protein
VLTVDNNMLVSVPVELRQCVLLEELSLEHNKLVRPLLDFRLLNIFHRDCLFFCSFFRLV